jgi:hypothetical protein
MATTRTQRERLRDVYRYSAQERERLEAAYQQREARRVQADERVIAIRTAVQNGRHPFDVLPNTVLNPVRRKLGHGYALSQMHPLDHVLLERLKTIRDEDLLDIPMFGPRQLTYLRAAIPYTGLNVPLPVFWEPCPHCQGTGRIPRVQA